MPDNTGSPTTVDQYIAGFPPAVRRLLEEVRRTIRQAAPEATEAIKYGIPTLVLHGNLVHFAAFRNHIGFYPTPSAIAAFQDELSAWSTAKGSVQFPLDQPLPLDLIARIVQFRVEEARQQAMAGKKTRR
jgi:uncharacterized protein YdhG (YjbR/CyaY superfamily)